MDMAKPKIRFKGYTDDWEQRKLGEVFKEYSEKGHTELPTLTIIQGGGTVKREDSDRNLMYDETNFSNPPSKERRWTIKSSFRTIL